MSELDLKDVHNIALKTLEPFVGKRLEWVCFDEESQSYYLMFEGLQTVAVSDVSPVVDGQDFAKGYLKANLEKAKQTLELQTIFHKNTSQMPLPLAKGKVATTADFVRTLRTFPDGSAVAGVAPTDNDSVLKELKGEPDGPAADQSGAENAPQA